MTLRGLLISEIWEDVVRHRCLTWIDTITGDICLVIMKIQLEYGLTSDLLQVTYDMEEILISEVHTEVDYVMLALKCLQLAKELNEYGANFLF